MKIREGRRGKEIYIKRKEERGGEAWKGGSVTAGVKNTYGKIMIERKGKE